MSDAALSLTIHAGPHDRHNCPVRFAPPTPLPAGDWELVGPDGAAYPLQRLAEGEYAFVASELRAGESQACQLRPRTAGTAPAVHLAHTEGRDITIQRRGELLTRYVYGDVPARPYFYPLIAPQGLRVTRSYPMETDVAGEDHDHPHHRSLYIAYGEVNGADNWSEESGHGYTIPQSVDSVQSGDAAGQFVTTSLWATADKQPLLTQHLTVTIWNTDDSVRLLDFAIKLEATHGDVHFGDTKEGGILSARVASIMDVDRGKGGRIENVYGGINEGETWGKAAHWCDYSGYVDGKRVGIAILDHPLSFRYPTHWHVRDYGLMTANPFGYAAYTNGVKNGSHTLPAGETLPFTYRVVLHEGDATQGQVNAHYLDFAAPPRVEVKS